MWEKHGEGGRRGENSREGEKKEEEWAERCRRPREGDGDKEMRFKGKGERQV